MIFQQRKRRYLRGGLPFRFWFWKGWALSFSYAAQPQTHHRAWRPSLYYLYLLSAAEISHLGPEQEYYGADSWGSSRAVQVRADRLCADARSCAFADQRAAWRDSSEGDAGI